MAPQYGKTDFIMCITMQVTISPVWIYAYIQHYFLLHFNLLSTNYVPFQDTYFVHSPLKCSFIFGLVGFNIKFVKISLTIKGWNYSASIMIRSQHYCVVRIEHVKACRVPHIDI